MPLVAAQVTAQVCIKQSVIGKGNCSAWAVWKPCSSFLGCVIAGLESAASQPTSVSEAVNGKHAPAALNQQTCMVMHTRQAFKSGLTLQCMFCMLMHIGTRHAA